MRSTKSPELRRDLAEAFLRVTGVTIEESLWEDPVYYPEDKLLELGATNGDFVYAIDMVHELGHFFAATLAERNTSNWSLDEYYYRQDGSRRHDLREAQALYFTKLVLRKDPALEERFLEEINDTGKQYYHHTTLSSYSKKRIDRQIPEGLVEELHELWKATLP